MMILERKTFKVITQVLCMLQSSLADPQTLAVVDVQLGWRSISQIMFSYTFMILSFLVFNEKSDQFC